MQVGNIVKFNQEITSNKDYNGYYRIRSIRGGNANLTGPFGRAIYHKRVPLSWLLECENEWYSVWSKSETYMCM
jgi:hypothetical protein